MLMAKPVTAKPVFADQTSSDNGRQRGNGDIISVVATISRAEAEHMLANRRHLLFIAFNVCPYSTCFPIACYSATLTP